MATHENSSEHTHKRGKNENAFPKSVPENFGFGWNQGCGFLVATCC